MLSDRSIRKAIVDGEIGIDPVDDLDRRLQPASLDVRLGHQFLVPRRHRLDYLDPKVDSTLLWDERDVEDGGHFTLHPGEFVLGTTMERVRLSPRIIARVEGKSSIGRLGILIHSTAGFVDPGFEGQVTLEIFCVSSLPTRLYPGMPIGQLAFDWLDVECERPYAGKYVGQTGPKASRYDLNWKGCW